MRISDWSSDVCSSDLPTGDPAFDGFGLVMRECAIPERYAHDLIEGFALDAREWRPRSEADMLRFCYHVAGAVCCMMAIFMGVTPGDARSEERRVGKACVSTGRFWRSQLY